MSNYIVLHKSLSKDQRNDLNEGGWGSQIGKAYSHAEDGFYKEAVELDLIKPVAVVEAKSLDHVFQLTNHIDWDWTENEEIVKHEDRVRSTSVGDIIYDQDAGVAHMVGMFGFGQINEGNDEATVGSIVNAAKNYAA